MKGTYEPLEKYLNKGKAHIFRLVAVCSSLLILAGIEMVIRLSGVAQDGEIVPSRLIQIVEDGQIKGEIVQSSEPFFLEKNGKMETNPLYHRGLGSGFPQSGSMRHLTFSKEPTMDRYFLMGGSAALGQQPVQLKIPQNWKTTPMGNSVHALPEALSISGALQKKLWQKGFDVEILNAGMIAQDSGGVRRLVQEVIAYKPKGILLYLGNNEGIGMAYGMNGVQLNKVPMRDLFHKSHIYRLLHQKFSHPTPDASGLLKGIKPEILGKVSHNEWKGAGQALITQNKATDTVHKALMERFKTNITAIQKLCDTHQIALYIVVTPPHLLYPPFYSANSPGLSESDIQQYSRHLESTRTLQHQKKWDALLQTTTAAIEIEPNHAQGWFLHANALQAKHKREEAMKAYEHALLLDLSRKRTMPEYARWAVDFCAQNNCKSISAHQKLKEKIQQKGFTLYDQYFGDHEHLTPQGCAWIASLFSRMFP